MSTRLRYAVQYPAKPGSGREDLFIGPTTHEVVPLDGEIMFWGRTEWADDFCSVPVPSPQHSPGRVVKVRETITREIVE